MGNQYIPHGIIITGKLYIIDYLGLPNGNLI